MQELYTLKEKLCDALGEYARKDLSSSSLQIIDTLAHACKNICKIIEECEKDEYSESMSRRSYYGDSYYGDSYGDGNSYDSERYVRPDGTYAMRSAKRDSMGRYARSSGDTVKQLKGMMNGADEKTRMEIQKLISKLEK